MYKLKEYIFLLLWLSTYTSLAPAAIAVVETDSLLISYDINAVGYLGFPEVSSNTLTFKPYMQLNVPADQFYYFSTVPYAVALDIQPKADTSILGYTLTASGSYAVGDDAHLGISGTLTKDFYGAGDHSGGVTGYGSWSVSQYQSGSSLQPVSGEIFLETNPYYYEVITHVDVPVFEEVPEEVFVGWEATYDEFGYQNGASPIIETVYVHKIVRYDNVPNYEYFLRTGGGSITMDNLTIEVAAIVGGQNLLTLSPTTMNNLEIEGAAVPLPPAGLLFMSGIGLAGWMGKCRRGKSQRT